MFRMASKKLPDFMNRLLAEAECSIANIKLVIPHQSSAMAMRLLSRKLRISEEQLLYITPDYGNTISASIPMGLHEAIRQERIESGDRVLLIGTWIYEKNDKAGTNWSVFLMAIQPSLHG